MNIKHLASSIVLTCATASLFACASSRGFNRGELRSRLDGPTVVTDKDIKKALSLKAQLPKPFKVGVYFKEAEPTHYYKAVEPWHWLAEDKEKILSLATQLKSSGEVSDVFIISDAAISGTDLKSLRLAAAQHGADALLVVSAVADNDRYTTDWAWTYIALVPMLFVPASETDALFITRAAMWDVRNEFLYLTAEGESLKKLVRPVAFTDDKKVTNEAKAESVDKLRDEIAKMMAGLKK